jgi:DNA primase
VIPRGFIQDLLARVDIVDVVGRYVALKKGGQNMLGLCPFHGEKTPSFTVSPAKQFYHCFGCGAHGNAIGFLMENRGLGYVEAIRDLAQQVGLTVPESDGADPQAARTRGLTDLLQQAADFYRDQLKSADIAKDYLKGRGITGVTAKTFALGYAPDDWQGLRSAGPTYEDPRLVDAGLVIVGDGGKRYDRFRGRVMFPIRNRRGAVIGFGARSLDGAEPKYLNSPETPVFRKGAELYGLFEAQEAIRARRRVIVCEGYLDVIQLSQAGFGEAVAALGTAITDTHVSTLLRTADHVIFAFDGDAAGFKAARRALEATLPVISENKRASFVLLPDGEDPDSLVKNHGPDAFEQALADAMPLSRWFIRSLSEGRSLDQAEDRASMVADAKPLLASMTAAALRVQLSRELAEVTRTPLDELQALHGMQPWRRLPSSQEGRTQRTAVVEGLAQRVLQQLWAHPQLAREFNAQIATEFAHDGGLIERQIVEVWRAATDAPTVTPGALLELLADSEHAAAYRSLSARDMLMQTDVEVARADLTGAFARLHVQRLEARCAELLTEYEKTAAPELLAEYREAFAAASAARLDAQVDPAAAG